MSALLTDEELAYNAIIGRKIRKIRLRNNITQQELGAYLGISFQQIQKYEIGANRIGPYKLSKLSELFDIPVSSFFPSSQGDQEKVTTFAHNDEFLGILLNLVAIRVFEQNKEKGFWDIPEEINQLDNLFPPDAINDEQSLLLNQIKLKYSQRNIGEAIALIHSELSEGLEGHRKNLKDDHLPDRDSLSVELADTIIRVLDLAGGYSLDVGGALVDKLAYNKKRLYKHCKIY